VWQVDLKIIVTVGIRTEDPKSGGNESTMRTIIDRKFLNRNLIRKLKELPAITAA